MLWLVAGLLSCSVHRPREHPVDVTRHYRVAVSADFGAVESDGSVLQPPMETRLALRVTSTPTRRFRDGSFGAQLRVEAAELTVNGAPASVELVGRTAELRTFANGEILDIGWIDKLSGPARHMDAFEVVFPAMSPAPPSVNAGAVVHRRIIWPFRSGRAVRWDNAVDAAWENQGVDKTLAAPAWELAYQGPWTLDGGTRLATPGIGYTAQGHGAGTVWMDVKTGQMTLHEFEWQRTVRVEGKAALTQTQSFQGRVEVIP